MYLRISYDLKYLSNENASTIHFSQMNNTNAFGENIQWSACYVTKGS